MPFAYFYLFFIQKWLQDVQILVSRNIFGLTLAKTIHLWHRWHGKETNKAECTNEELPFHRTGSYGAAAAENMCTYDLTKKIVVKFLVNGIFEPGDRGSPPTMMQPWKVAYLEALVTQDAFVYWSEIQTALRDDLNLPPREIPSIPTICRTLLNLDLTRHKASKVPSERFSPENIARRAAFVNWRRTVDPRKLYFVDKTVIQHSDGRRTNGRCHTNNNVPLISNRGDEREKMSVLSVICYNQGVLGAYPIDGSLNRVQFNYGNSLFSSFNWTWLFFGDGIILVAKNIPLVKLPPYSYDFNPIESLGFQEVMWEGGLSF